MTVDLVPIVVVAIPATFSLVRESIRLLFLWGVFRKEGTAGLAIASTAVRPAPMRRSRDDGRSKSTT
jgi:hypothetical protein